MAVMAAATWRGRPGAFARLAVCPAFRLGLGPCCTVSHRPVRRMTQDIGSSSPSWRAVGRYVGSSGRSGKRQQGDGPLQASTNLSKEESRKHLTALGADRGTGLENKAGPANGSPASVRPKDAGKTGLSPCYLRCAPSSIGSAVRAGKEQSATHRGVMPSPGTPYSLPYIVAHVARRSQTPHKFRATPCPLGASICLNSTSGPCSARDQAPIARLFRPSDIGHQRHMM